MKKDILKQLYQKYHIGGVRIRRPNMELQKPHVVQGDTASIYEGENTLTDSGQNSDKRSRIDIILDRIREQNAENESN